MNEPRLQGPNCPSCREPAPEKPFLLHRDPVGDRPYALYKCRSCGLVFSDPMKNPGAAWYAEAEKIWAPGPASGGTPPWRLAALERLVSMGTRHGRLLEIGCAEGSFLRAAAALGFDPHGIDFSEEKVKTARADGLTGVRALSFDDFYRANSEKFGAAAFFQVLEHLEDPSGFIGRVRDILSPGGFIMLDVPDAQRPLPSASGLIDLPPHHLTRWSKTALKGFLENSGFEIVSLDSVMSFGMLTATVFNWLTVGLSRLRKRFGGRARPGPAAARGAAGPARGPSVVYRLLKTAYFFFLLPLSLPVLVLWYARLRAADRGFYIFCLARVRADGTNSL